MVTTTPSGMYKHNHPPIHSCSLPGGLTDADLVGERSSHLCLVTEKGGGGEEKGGRRGGGGEEKGREEGEEKGRGGGGRGGGGRGGGGRGGGGRGGGGRGGGGRGGGGRGGGGGEEEGGEEEGGEEEGGEEEGGEEEGGEEEGGEEEGGWEEGGGEGRKEVMEEVDCSEVERQHTYAKQIHTAPYPHTEVYLSDCRSNSHTSQAALRSNNSRMSFLPAERKDGEPHTHIIPTSAH